MASEQLTLAFDSASTSHAVSPAPSVLVMPRHTDDVVAAMAAARAAGVPVVTRGAGTGLCGGANAVDGCIVLSLHRMDRVLDIDTANRKVRVQPGVLNGALKRAVAELPCDAILLPPVLGAGGELVTTHLDNRACTIAWSGAGTLYVGQVAIELTWTSSDPC